MSGVDIPRAIRDAALLFTALVVGTILGAWYSCGFRGWW